MGFCGHPLLLQAIFFYVPMFQGAFYSFTNWTGLTYNYKFVGLNNFKLLFMDPKFMNAIILPQSLRLPWWLVRLHSGSSLRVS